MSKPYNNLPERAEIVFTPKAICKMNALIQGFESEVAWHGVGERLDGERFLISDIVVYPQTVTGGNVEMDEEKYARWIIENDGDDRMNHIIMQGHSHVRFPCTPSSTDKKHQDEITDMVSDDGFYIFLIWNKLGERYGIIYDKRNNIIYGSSDIDYSMDQTGFEIESFMERARSKVIPKVAASKSKSKKSKSKITTYPQYEDDDLAASEAPWWRGSEYNYSSKEMGWCNEEDPYAL